MALDIGRNFGFASIAKIGLSGEQLRGNGGFTYVKVADTGMLNAKYHLFEDTEVSCLPSKFLEHLKDMMQDETGSLFFAQRTVSDLHVYRCERNNAVTIVKEFFKSVDISEKDISLEAPLATINETA